MRDVRTGRRSPLGAWRTRRWQKVRPGDTDRPVRTSYSTTSTCGLFPAEEMWWAAPFGDGAARAAADRWGDRTRQVAEGGGLSETAARGAPSAPGDVPGGESLAGAASSGAGAATRAAATRRRERRARQVRVDADSGK
jgi:hypothetical protein